MSEPDNLEVVEPLASSVKSQKRIHTPTVLQMEASECGAAALAIVLGYFGRFVSLERLRIDCGVSRDGSKARNIVTAARAYGLRAQGKEMEPRALVATYRFPVIVHWNFNHFLVVEGFDKTHVFLNDPAEGPRRVEWHEFESSFTGIAIAFEPGAKFTRGGHASNLMRALRKRLRGSEGALAMGVLLNVLLVVPGLALPTFVRVFVDSVLIGGLDAWLPPLLTGLVVAALAAAVLSAFQQRVLRRMETRFALSTSSSFLWHVLRLPMEFYSQRYAGDVGSRLSLNDRVASLLSEQLATAILNMTVIALYALLMFTYDVTLTLISIGIAATNIVLLNVVSRKRKDGNSYFMQEQGKLIGTSMGGLQLIETLKATGTESDFFGRWAGHQAKVLNAQQSLGIYTMILQVVPLSLTMLNAGLILWIGAGRVIDSTMTIGMLMAFQTLAASFMFPVSQLVGLGTALQEVSASLARLDDVLRYEVDGQLSEKVEAPPSPEERARLSGRVELRDVTFGYSPQAPPLIEGFNLILKPGDRVAIVGGTGSGKSTTARLVAGLYKPWSGEILFDDRPRTEIPRRLLTRSVAQVDQEIVMFEGTLRENLTLWDPTVPETSLIRAAHDAVIHDDIVNRPGGYNAVVGEGGNNFSGGQRQRLEIARTLVGDPAILVLDEATSALDAILEKQIDDNLRRRGCTCLIVAHRLSTIRDCDEILVMDRGKVVERGTHAEMIEKGGPYARLIRAELATAVDQLVEEPEVSPDAPSGDAELPAHE